MNLRMSINSGLTIVRTGHADVRGVARFAALTACQGSHFPTEVGTDAEVVSTYVLRLIRFAQCWVIFAVGIAIYPHAILEAAESSKPNVVFILVDDQGYYDLGCYGASEVRTPRIDGLAKDGIRFTDYYAAAPICSPSRAGLLTGCYPRRVGNHIWVHRADSTSGLHPDELTLAELFQENGYATACIGKWHLGFEEPFLPRQQGFDHYFGLLHNLDPVEVVYFEDVGGVPLLRNGEVVKRPADAAELTQRYTDEAIGFIQQNRERPFFLYLPHTMLHHPLGVSEAFRGKSGFGEYGDAIEEMDFHVGRIMDCLKEQGVDDNTIVVYASDNGRGPGRTADQPIRGRKLSTFEGGIRVPAICWGPGAGVQAGVENGAVIRAMDWYPSLATMAEIPVPKDRVIDGRDISPLLKGETQAVPAAGLGKSLNAKVPLRRRWDPPAEWSSLIKQHEYNDAFFYHGSHGALSAVRWRQWKLVLNPSLGLFNLTTDPSESQPVRNGEIARKLRGMAIIFQHEMRLDARPAGMIQRSSIDQRTSLADSLLDGLNQKLDVVYAERDTGLLKLDLFRPKGAWSPLPAIVCIHGGGWQKGNKENHRQVAQALAARGFVTASISYRLSGQAPFPAAIHDCKDAVRFLRSNAHRFGIDPEQIGAIGLSAGGHLAALLGASAGVPELEGADWGSDSVSSKIQAVVPMGAQTDLLSSRIGEISADSERGGIWRQFLGGSLAEEPETYQSASPIEHLDVNDPPFWLITGEKDDSSTRAVSFRQRLDELGIDSGMTVISDAPHPFLSRQGWFDQMLESASVFFKSNLSGK